MTDDLAERKRQMRASASIGIAEITAALDMESSYGRLALPVATAVLKWIADETDRSTPAVDMFSDVAAIVGWLIAQNTTHLVEAARRHGTDSAMALREVIDEMAKHAADDAADLVAKSARGTFTTGPKRAFDA